MRQVCDGEGGCRTAGGGDGGVRFLDGAGEGGVEFGVFVGDAVCVRPNSFHSNIRILQLKENILKSVKNG